MVAGIFVILAAMILGSLVQSKHKTLRVTCMANLKTIGIMLRLYSDENDDFFPVSSNEDFAPLRSGGYLPDGPHYGCPAATFPSTLADASDYVYVGSGVKLPVPSPFSTSAAYDRSGNHPLNSWMNILYVDSHVEGHRPGQNDETN